MKKQNGMSIIALIIIIAIIIFMASIIFYKVNDMIQETELQDLKTNMLLIQAKAKKGLEEVSFQTVNLNKNKAEDLEKMNQIKKENLAGIAFADVAEEVKESASQLPEEIVIDESCYYLNDETLNNMGVKNLDLNKYGYFIVKYDFEKITVEVISTKGYNGNYTLTQINQLVEE